MLLLKVQFPLFAISMHVVDLMYIYLYLSGQRPLSIYQEIIAERLDIVVKKLQELSHFYRDKQT